MQIRFLTKGGEYMPDLHDISQLPAELRTLFSVSSEIQLKRFHEPEPGLFLAESPLVIGRALDVGYEPIAMLMDDTEPQNAALLERVGEIPVCTAPESALRELCRFPLVRGAVCLMRRRRLPEPEVLCRNARRIAVLENVVNPTNVGAIIRSAAALGMDAVLLTPACSDPLYRRAARVSMGTVFQVPWTYLGEDTQAGTDVAHLHEMGFRTAAMALTDKAVDIDAPALLASERLAVILGTEGEGLHPETIAASDYTVCIPMSHGVDSLNVAAASAVAFWNLGQNGSVERTNTGKKTLRS